GLYCGRNEGYPPPNIDRKLRQFVSQLSPGIGYISSSADDGVTGHGPYCAQPPKVYFERQSGKIHTERGMPAVMNIESMQRTLSPDALWPQSVQWGQHDYTMLGAQRAQEFNSMVAKAMGKVNNAQPNSQFSPLTSQLNSFTRWAQLINYNGYRAMFESGSKTRSGLLIWMSHPCWPTMVWQTYDYYFDPTAAYFGVKKACEPLHIQLNALTDSIEVVNLFAGDHQGVTATATLYDIPSARKLWTKTTKLHSRDDSTVGVHALNKVCGYEDLEERASGGNSARLLRLELNDKRGLVSLNDYYLEDSNGTLADIVALPPPQLSQRTVVTPTADGYRAEVTLSNTGKTIAPFLRLNLKNVDGMQILPAVYSDNYFTLLPGERRTVTITWKRSDGDTAKPVIEVTPLN
ncbi:MAG: beta-glycosidase, partial [Muribaculaceae bacterium]|nr:beta-glycosidase [Muribaculaceae bacterium]